MTMKITDRWKQDYSDLGLKENPFILNQYNRLPDQYHNDEMTHGYFVDRGQFIRTINQSLKNIIQNNQPGILVIHGGLGFGKTSILYMIYNEINGKRVEIDKTDYSPMVIDLKISKNKTYSPRRFLKKIILRISEEVDDRVKEVDEKKDIFDKSTATLTKLFSKKPENELKKLKENAFEQKRFGIKIGYEKLINAYFEKEYQVKTDEAEEEDVIDSLIEMLKNLVEQIKPICGAILLLVDDADNFKGEQSYRVRDVISSELEKLPIFFIFFMNYVSSPDVLDPFNRSTIRNLEELATLGTAEELIKVRLKINQLESFPNPYHPFTSSQIREICNKTYSVPLYIEHICLQTIELACDKEEKEISNETFLEGLLKGWINILALLTKRKREIIIEIKKHGDYITPYELEEIFDSKRCSLLEHLKEMERRKIVGSKYQRKTLKSSKRNGRAIKTERSFYLNDAIDAIPLDELELFL